MATEKPLNVHHVVYRKLDPWAYPHYLYQTACDDCHRERHEIVDKLIDAIRISLKDIPAKRLEKMAQNLCANAMEEIAS